MVDTADEMTAEDIMVQDCVVKCWKEDISKKSIFGTTEQ